MAAGTDPLHRIDLNIASIDATTMTGQITTKRTATNVSGRNLDLDVVVQAPPGVTISVSSQAPGPNGPRPADTKLHLLKNQPLDFWVTISAPTAANGQYVGRITLNPKAATPVTLPVAFVKTQGLVTLTNTCDPNPVDRRPGVAHCAATVANFASVAANVTLSVTNMDRAKGLDFTNISAPAGAIVRAGRGDVERDAEPRRAAAGQLHHGSRSGRDPGRRLPAALAVRRRADRGRR